MTKKQGDDAPAGQRPPIQSQQLASEAARQALLGRPPFSLRLHILLVSLLTFLFGIGVAFALWRNSENVEEKLGFLDIANQFVNELQQARRFEKNYFLYGSNLADAIDYAHQARDILKRNTEPLRRVVGEKSFSIMLPHLERYQELLARLADHERQGGKPELGEKKIELELREHGQQMVTFAESLVQKEREYVRRAMTDFRHILVGSLVFLTLFMLAVSWLLRQRIMAAIRRFSGYTQRIAQGDYTPITPARRFRDEFCDLALAINGMIAEIQVREDVLIQSHKMRAVGTLTAGVAHELNNPLNNITLTAHSLLEDYRGLPDDERLEMLTDLVQEADRARGIIRNLLDFARESGSQVEPLDLAGLLRETIQLAANQIRLSGIRIEFNATDNLPRVHGDAQQLQQVFLNLILNAMDASNKGGKIQIVVVPADEPNYLAVKVIDFGAGIPEHIKAAIFDPFFTTKAKGKGTGLGLSVSQGIVAKHGGRILVSSREGLGSTFSVILPITTIPASLPDLHPA